MHVLCTLLLCAMVLVSPVHGRDQFAWSLPQGLNLISIQNRPATSSVADAQDLLDLTSASFVARTTTVSAQRRFEIHFPNGSRGFSIQRGGTEGYLISMPRSRLLTLQETTVSVPSQWYLAATKFVDTTSTVVLLDPVTLEERGVYQPRGIRANEYFSVHDDGRTVFRSRYRSGCCSTSATCPTAIIAIDTITGTTTVVDPRLVDTECRNSDYLPSAAIKPDGSMVAFRRTINAGTDNASDRMAFWFPSSTALATVGRENILLSPSLRSILLGLKFVSLPSGFIPEVFRSDGIRLSFTSDGVETYTASLNGQRVAYTAKPPFGSVNSEISITDIDGSNTTALTANQVADVAYEFTPNNERLIFGSKREGVLLVEYWMKLDGTDVRRMFPNFQYSGVHRVMAAIQATK